MRDVRVRPAQQPFGACPECGAAGPGALRMPPQWRILIAALGAPTVILLVWIAWWLLQRNR